MCGPDWPSGGTTFITSLSFLTHLLAGEIDIIEGVHDQDRNLYTLHTAPGCTLDKSKSVAFVAPSSKLDLSKVFTGSVLRTDCDAWADSNSGCGIEDTDTASYGAGLNAQGGGVFATLWDADGIRICAFFPSHNRQRYSCVRMCSSGWLTFFRVLPLL